MGKGNGVFKVLSKLVLLLLLGLSTVYGVTIDGASKISGSGAAGGPFAPFVGPFKAQDCGANGPNASKIAYTITVSNSYQANFNKIQAAIDSIPSQNDRWVRILVSPGTYREKVTVYKDKPCIILEGNSGSDIIITYDAHLYTDKSATFTSRADNFVAKNIVFKNAYPNKGPVQGYNTVEQSVAVEGCKISVLPIDGGRLAGFITAQGRNSGNEMTGFVFKAGTVIENGNAHSYLGRAYGAYSRVIWYDTEFSDVLVPQGWQAWNQHEENLEYAEVDCYGPGSNLSNRVIWLKKPTKQDVQKFTDISYIDQDGWLANQP
ncbi:putative pectinesterase 10 [Telopea speciosissima]|uniref:putative pectinesterase 10 n=1 Tax=Telopea speciosissima TaxID=54955 RepID=UPI001CC70B5D|nr:putative pectinesterase 10 [Telopea speciosissima]